MKTKVRVTLEVDCPVYRYRFVGKGAPMERTDEVLRVEKKTKVLFKGSDAAFEIWKKNHVVPIEAKVENYRGQEYETYSKFQPQQCFAQCSIYHGR